MAGIPSLVGFDFTYGMASQTPAIARIMADAGERLGKSIETMVQTNEAKAKAPAVSQAYSVGYAKVSQGDFSGFQDMAAGMSMAAGNPLLMQMAKEANDLGAQLAHTYTTTALAKERFSMEDRRLDIAEAKDDNRYADSLALQDDRQAAAEKGAIIKENQERTKRNEAKKELEASTGQKQQLEPLLPIPADPPPSARARAVPRGTGRQAKLTGPAGLPPVEPDLPMRENPLGAEAADAEAAAAAAADREAAASKPMGPAGTQAAAAAVPVPEEVKKELVPTVSSTRKDTKNQADAVSIPLGNLRVKVGTPKGDSMEVQGKDINTETGSISTKLGPDKESLRARSELIEGVSIMQANDPEAAAFYSQFLTQGKGLKFENVQREGGKVISAQVYGIDKNDKAHPYNPKTVKEGEPPEADVVDGEFYNAYQQVAKNYPTVKEKYGVEIEGPPQSQEAPKPNPMEKIKDDPELVDIQKTLQTQVTEGKITKEEAARQLVKAQKEKKERRAAGVDEEGERKEKEESKKMASRGKVQEIKRQIAEIDKKLESGTQTISMFNLSGGGAGNMMTGKLTVTETNQLKLQRHRLQERLRELE